MRVALLGAVSMAVVPAPLFALDQDKSRSPREQAEWDKAVAEGRAGFVACPEWAALADVPTSTKDQLAAAMKICFDRALVRPGTSTQSEGLKK